MKQQPNQTPEILKISEINPESAECVRVILMKNKPNLYTLIMEGFADNTAQEMTQLGTAKTFTSQDLAIIQFEYLVTSLATAWEV